MREPLDSQSVKAALVTASTPWQIVDVHGSIDSTNLEALRRPSSWRVVVADYQNAGRGRLTRQWQAPPGTSIAVSAIVPVPDGRAADLGWLPLLSGMAMRQALADVAQVAGRLKWPNDVMVQERLDQGSAQSEAAQSEAAQSEAAQSEAADGRPWLKISGVLCEMVPSGELVVIGAGANVAQQRSELPVETATSLLLCGSGDVRREDLVVRYLGELADLHRVWSAGGAGLEALRRRYRSWCLTIGLDVDVHEPDGKVVRGTATGVDDTGRLLVAVAGQIRAHAAGDVVHVRRSSPDSWHTA